MESNHGGVRNGAGRRAINGIGCERRTISILRGDWKKWGAVANYEQQSLSEWIRNLANKRTKKIGPAAFTKPKKSEINAKG